MGTADVPNFFRKPWGPGWALVGDAGYMKDPMTGLGIADAFRDADLLSTRARCGALGQCRAGRRARRYQAKRDAAAMPMYEMTLMMASGEMAFGAG